MARSASSRVEQGDWRASVAQQPRGSLDLLYADPPFNTGDVQSDRAGRFEDSWPATTDYVRWLRERLEATLPALKPSACVLLHVDFRVCHHVRLLLDELL